MKKPSKKNYINSINKEFTTELDVAKILEDILNIEIEKSIYEDKIKIRKEKIANILKK